MITERFGKHTITTYETIDELTIDRFTAWNKYMMIDGALGSTFEDIDRLHLSQLTSVIDDKGKAMQQIANLRELIYGITQGLNYQHSAYCCMIHSIDDKLITDYTDTGIQETLRLLAKIGVPNGAVKKKIPVGKKLFMALWSVYSRISSIVQKSTTTGRR